MSKVNNKEIVVSKVSKSSNNKEKNSERRIKIEVSRCQKVLNRLLKRGENGKPGGIKFGSERHHKLERHITLTFLTNRVKYE